MLWSLTKILVFVVAVAAAALGAGYLLEAEGGVQIAVAGNEYNLGALQSVIALIVLVVAVWVLFKVLSFLLALWHFMNGDDTAISRFFARNREARGYEALSKGLMALASGEGRTALSKAEKAERYLEKPELTALVKAQAAEMAGDRKTAEETYRKMVENDKTRFIGVRGIMKQKIADGDKDTAFKLAEKAFGLKPKHVETQDTLLEMQAQRKDWGGARKTLHAKLRNGALPRNVFKRREAVLALSEAKTLHEQDKISEAREAAIQANKLSPDLVPGAVMAAQAYQEKGQINWAAKVLRKSWDVAPHPDLALAFAALEPNESPQDRLRRFNVITRVHPDHPETMMLKAELLIAAEDFPEARRALGDIPENDLTARSATLMAAIERGQGADDNVVKGWLARAVTAPRDPQWICDICQTIHSEWEAVCESCGAFDTLSWRRPTEAEMKLPGGAEMLPLLVGTGQPDANLPTAMEDGAVVDVTVDKASDDEPIILNGADKTEQAETRH